MRNPRHRLFLLVTALGILGIVGGEWLRSWMVPAREKTIALAPVLVPAERVVRFESAEATDAATPTAVEPRERRIETLSAAESTQFTTLCDLHLLAADTELDLTTKQWAALTAAVVQAQAVRHNYEAQIAIAQEVAPGHFRVEIPAYAAAGDELRRQFLADLQNGLGSDAAAEVWTQLGRRLEGRFAGFGVSAQTLEITSAPARAPGDVQVERIAHYWNSVDDRDRVTTRRETHFPADEDPTGESWHALLALVSKAD
ncbi:MAG: hypothetical protein HYV96_15470 [Opitutae bacterium]|nr:hypothetical protein [Opitutae bacterium]